MSSTHRPLYSPVGHTMTKNLHHYLVIAAILISPYSFSQTLERHVDRIFVNGKIWTEDPSQAEAQALAVSGDSHIELHQSARRVLRLWTRATVTWCKIARSRGWDLAGLGYRRGIF